MPTYKGCVFESPDFEVYEKWPIDKGFTVILEKRFIVAQCGYFASDLLPKKARYFPNFYMWRKIFLPNLYGVGQSGLRLWCTMTYIMYNLAKTECARVH